MRIQRAKSLVALLALLLFVGTMANAQVSAINVFPGPDYINGIAAGPDGALWFAVATGYIGRITMVGDVSTYPVPYAGSYPVSITAGSDGALWFTDLGTNSIGRIATGNAAVTEYPVPTADAFRGCGDCAEITAGPDGALWFVEDYANKIGRVTTAGKINEYVAAKNSGPTSITAGSDGALWFTEGNSGKIGRMTTAGKITNEYAVPTPNSSPVGITTGPDGALWFTEAIAQIGRITTKGAIVEYPSNRGYDDPSWITAGPDGALWFIDIYSGYYAYAGQVTTSGAFPNFFGLPIGPPQGLASGPDGSIWMSDWHGGFNQVVPTARRNAVDFSAAAGVPSPSTLTQFTQAGVQYAVAEAPQTPDGGLASQQLTAFYNAGIQTGAYCFLYFYQGADAGTQQAENCLGNISEPLSEGIVSFVALDVEEYLPPHGSYEILADRLSTIQTALNALTSDTRVRKKVIYTNQGYWSFLTKNADFSVYPLWNSAHGSFTSYADSAGNFNCTPTKKSLIPTPHGGTGIPSLTPPASITDFSITNNVVTFFASNVFQVGQKVAISGLSAGAFLNGQKLTVIASGLSNSQFEANFSHADVGSTSDSGTATYVLFGGWQVQSGTQYDIGSGGGACLFGVQVDFDVLDPSLFQ
ncbi:MAG: GH25 family lysozyme [Terriglobales bacterium]